MARVIVFYTPKKFRKKETPLPPSQSRKVIQFFVPKKLA